MRNPADRRFGRTSWLRVAVIIIFSFSLLIAIKTPSTQGSSLVGFVLLIFMVSALWLWSKFRIQACLKQTYIAQEKQLNGQHMDIDESGIIGQWADGTASYRYKWAAFERFIDLPDAFLFLPNSVSFVRIPKD